MGIKPVLGPDPPNPEPAYSMATAAFFTRCNPESPLPGSPFQRGFPGTNSATPTILKYRSKSPFEVVR
jgi:hypothetical protein